MILLPSSYYFGKGLVRNCRSRAEIRISCGNHLTISVWPSHFRPISGPGKMSAPWRSGVPIDHNPSAALHVLHAVTQPQHGEDGEPAAAAEEGVPAAADLVEEDVRLDEVGAPGTVSVASEDSDSDTFSNGVEEEEQEEHRLAWQRSDSESDHDEDAAVGPGPQGSVSKDLLALYTSHNLSGSAMEGVLELVRKHALQDLPSFKTLKARAVKELPQVEMDFEYVHLATNQIIMKQCQSQVPHEISRNTRLYKLRYIVSYLSFRDIWEFHLTRHPGTPPQVILSSDNVPISNSGGKSFDIISVEFPHCKDVYPLRIFQPFQNVKCNVLRNLAIVLEEICHCNVELLHLVADLPKKASLVGIKQCGGFHSCQYCEERGVRSAAALTTVYPLDGNAPLRTHTRVKEIVDNPQFEEWTRQPERHEGDLLGLKARSPLLDVPGFDIVHDCPTDPLHNLHLGVARRLFSRTFMTPGPGIKAFMRRRQKLDRFDSQFPQCKVTSEQTRKPRAFSAFWKGSEFKSLTVTHFPLLLQILEHHPDPKRKLLQDIWCLFGYLSHFLLNDFTHELSLSPEDAMAEFCKAYEEYLGKDQLHFNVHLFSHSLLVHQRFGSLATVSAYSSENMYQVLLRCYAAGTSSVGKQALQNIMLRYQGSQHKCRPGLKFRDKETQRTQDNFVFQDGFRVWKVTKVDLEEKELSAVEIVGEPFNYICASGTQVPLHEIGVWKSPFTTGHAVKKIKFGDVSGKVVKEASYMVCLGKSVLQESSF